MLCRAEKNKPLTEETVEAVSVVKDPARRSLNPVQQYIAPVSRSRRESVGSVTAPARTAPKRSRRAVTFNGPCIVYNLTFDEIEDDLVLMSHKPKRSRGRPPRRK